MQQPFEHAVVSHGATVLRVCTALLGPGADAEDAWSETFLSAIQAWPDLEEAANVEAWFVRIAQRKSIDIVRKRQRTAIPFEVTPEQTSDLGIPDTHAREIWKEVAQLPERQRLALAYHYMIGLPHAETAALIGGTPAAVRRAAADGMAKLRTRLRVDVEQRPQNRGASLSTEHPTALQEGGNVHESETC